MNGDGAQESAVIVPCFNEETRFSADYFEEMLRTLDDAEFVFVDDGSNDGTAALLSAFTESRERTHVLTLPMNRGKANALRSGFHHAVERFPSVRWLAYIDADGSFSTEEMARLLEAAAQDPRSARVGENGIFAVFPDKRHLDEGEDSGMRAAIGAGAASFLRFGWADPPPQGTQIGMKVFKNNAGFRAVLAQPFRTRWFFEFEALLRAGSAELVIRPYELRTLTRVPNSHIGLSSVPGIAREMLYLKRLQLQAGLTAWRSGRS